MQRGFQSGSAVGEVRQGLGPGQGGGCVAGGPNIGERAEGILARQTRGHGGETLHRRGELFAGEAVEEQAVEIGFVVGADEFAGEREGAVGRGAGERVERGDEGRGAFGSERQRAGVGEGEFGFAGEQRQKSGAEFLGRGARIRGAKGTREVPWSGGGSRRQRGRGRCRGCANWGRRRRCVRAPEGDEEHPDQNEQRGDGPET